MCIECAIYDIIEGVEDMAEVIAIINQKGGVGKTTTAEALAVGLATTHGKKVLCIDMDAQGNLSFALKAQTGVQGVSVYDVLTTPNKIKSTFQHVADNITVIASTPLLATMELNLNAKDRATRLKQALQPIRNDFDYIIIDTPPALSVVTINALAASDRCVITSQADLYSVQGLSTLYATIETVKAVNPELKIEGVLLTRFNPRTSLSKVVVERLENMVKDIDTKLFKTTIRECNAIKEAQASLKDIFTYAPKSNAAIDYRNFIKEVLHEEDKPILKKPLSGLFY